MALERVSVIIPTFNYGSYLPEAIDSALAQTRALHEIIVVDDGSTDNTREIAERFGDKIVYVYQQNAGLSAARNTGIRHSTGDVVAFLDADDVWYPEKTAKQLEAFNGDPDIGMVYCSIREFDSTTGQTLTVWTRGGNELGALEALLMFHESTVIAIGSTGMVRREVIESIGDFDTGLRHSEDWDFSYRVARKYKLAFVPEVLAGYRNHGTNMHKNIGAMEKAMVRCFEKAFETDDPDVRRLENKAYGNLYSVLAGSYFHSGKYRDCARCAMKSLGRNPRMLGRFLNFPIRWVKRRAANR